MVAAAAARRVRYLYWSGAVGDLDLSATSAIDVRLDVPTCEASGCPRPPSDCS